MARLGLVDQTELARWADSREAPGDLPRLIRRLILETGHGVVQLGFPGGEGIATGSWDGTARATEPTAFIPAGLSLWELSTNSSANTKADKDYIKRITTPDGSAAGDCTYVAVSLRRWAKRHEWAREKSSDGPWKAVRAYGVDDLETWLESAPITHAWLSELLGFHPHGLLSAETWWTSWSGLTKPPFPAAAVLAGRNSEADALRAKLAGPGEIITVQGASRDDIIAFLVALALISPKAHGEIIFSRMALIDTVEAWRRLRNHPVPLTIIPRTQEVINDLGVGSEHHLIVPIVGEGPADITLKPIDSQEAKKTLAAVGLGNRIAEETGKLARLSLLAARRRIAQKPELHHPRWATAPVPRLQRRALLIGKWNEGSKNDISIASNIWGADYDSVREDIASLMLVEDPLLARFDSSIGLVSHFDAWLLLRGYLGKDDLDLFQSAALAIFGEIDPALELSPDDRWKASLLGKIPAYSGDLRLGMATTLALLGSHGDMVVAGSGLTGQDWASWTVRKILEMANQDRTCHLWASLRDVLMLFAEAAPTVFLEAVRDGLLGEAPLLQRMFMDGAGRNTLFIDSPHSSLLWALETCAWSPADFGQTVDLLARLAEIDPGGRLGNRPISCLMSIFCSWYPQNSVSLERRLATLDGLRKRHVAIAWQLMLSMLPDPLGGSAMDMNGPRFRDWKPQKISVSQQEYREQIDEVGRRLLEDAATDPIRWISLVKKLPSLPQKFRAEMFERLVTLSADENIGESARDQIWEALRSQAARHREYPRAKWSLPPDEVARLGELGKLFEPSATSKRIAWLFDESMPKISGSERVGDEYRSKLSRLRMQAASDLASSSSWPEVYVFAVSRKLPWLFGMSLAEAGITENEREILGLLRAYDEPRNLDLAQGYLSKRFRIEGWPWVEKHLCGGDLLPEQSARLLLATDDFPKAWEVAEAAGEDVTTFFWSHFRTFGLGHDFPYVEVVAQRLLKVGRPGGALDLLALYMQKDSATERADLMATCLEDLLLCNPKESDIRVLSDHNLTEIFSFLERSLLDVERLARLEWAYLKVLDHNSSPPTLSRYLAQSPSFFVDVVSQVYRPHLPNAPDDEGPSSEPEVEVDESKEAIASKAYQILSGWRTIPGRREDGTVDGEFLKQWIDESRQLLGAVHRLEVGDLHIGSVLASSPPAPDGIWPCVEVRDLLETLQAGKIEDGLRLRIHNDRGVTSRGMLDGGEQERDLAAKYRKEAEQFGDHWPRTAAVLRSLAEGYEHQARRQDEEAEKRRKGFET